MQLEGLVAQAARHLTARARGPSVKRPLPGLVLLAQDSPSAFEASLYEPVLCLILEGRKLVALGEQSLSFGPGECLLVSHELPVRSRVTKAPYVALVLQLDLDLLRTLRDEVAGLPPEGEGSSAAVVQRADPGLLEALHRYVALADSPTDAKVLGPLVSKELHYRLLVAPFGGMLRTLVRQETHGSAVARAIAHLRDDLRAPISIPGLARRVGMSASSFHAHFKTVTSTTPLQYQKALRLLEARRLLRAGRGSVTATAYEVGYESSSQFSREYARKFGVRPSEDLASAT
jgi:AraC-like DNA-binding protein